jgi:hypothetical protein
VDELAAAAARQEGGDVSGLSWQRRAACKRIPVGEFYPAPKAPVAAIAQAACQGCQVRAECLEWACKTAAERESDRANDLRRAARAAARGDEAA